MPSTGQGRLGHRADRARARERSGGQPPGISGSATRTGVDDEEQHRGETRVADSRAPGSMSSGTDVSRRLWLKTPNVV